MLIILTYMFFHLPHSFERFLPLDCLACGQGNIWHFNLTPFLLLFLPLQWTVPYNFFLEKGGQFCVHLRSLTSKLGRTPSISDTSLHPSLRSDCYLKLMESFLIPETLKISWTENAGVIHIHASELQSQWTPVSVNPPVNVQICWFLNWNPVLVELEVLNTFLSSLLLTIFFCFFKYSNVKRKLILEGRIILDLKQKI